MRFVGALLVACGLMGCAAIGSSSDESSASSAADITAASECTASTDTRALLNDPMKDPDDAAARLGCLAQALTAQHDGRAPFATLYTAITNAVDTAIKAGRFEDGVWTASYLTEFAELYRVAYIGYVDGQSDTIAGSWRVAFDAAKVPKTLIVQDMSLGVNAHVNHDLAHALYTVGIGSGATRAMRQRDHFKVNDILHENVQAALTTLANLYAPGLAQAPATVMRVLSDTYFVAVETGRLKAWLDAIALTDTTSILRKGVEDEIEDSSKLLAEALLVPTWDDALAAKLKELEQGN